MRLGNINCPEATDNVTIKAEKDKGNAYYLGDVEISDQVVIV